MPPTDYPSIHTATDPVHNTYAELPNGRSVYNRGHEIFRPLRFVLFVAGVAAASLPTSITARCNTGRAGCPSPPVNALFDGMTKRDAAGDQRTTAPGRRDGDDAGWQNQPRYIRCFCRTVLENRQRNISRSVFTIHWYGSITTSQWYGRRFEFLVDGKVAYCGTDLFNLVPQRWQVAHRKY